MSADSNGNRNSPPAEAGRPRRGSVTGQAFTNLFSRANSLSGAPTPAYPLPIPAATQEQRRRMSITTLGLSGTSPGQPSPFPFGRRTSVSTAGGSIEENAIDDDEAGPNNPTASSTRRVSFGTQARRRPTAGSPGTAGRSPSSPLSIIPSGGRGGVNPSPQAQAQASTKSKPGTLSDNVLSPRSGEGFSWSENLRSRAESSVSQSQRPNFSLSSGGTAPALTPRNPSVSEAPPATMPAPVATPVRVRKQPDDFQERILKGDFYMD